MAGYQYAYLNIVFTIRAAADGQHGPMTREIVGGRRQVSGPLYVVFNASAGREMQEVSSALEALDQYGAQGWMTAGPLPLDGSTPDWVRALAQELDGIWSTSLAGHYFMRRELP